MEHAMKHAAVKEALNLGFLTDQERNRILLEATARQTRIYNERLEAAKDEGKLEGKLELARKVLARTLSSSALEVAMDHLSGLESAEAIDDALMAMMAGN
jgi:predicted transposase YdaD